LLDGLRIANGAAVDNSGGVTPDSLGKYVYDKVTDASPNQKPIRKVEASGDTILRIIPILQEPQKMITYLDRI